MAVKNFKELIVWQKAMDVAELVYGLEKELPRKEVYSLCSQLTRSAVSIPSNIAEGQARRSSKEFVQYLSVARGSAAELETQLLLSVRIGYLDSSDVIETQNILNEVVRMLNALIAKLSTTH
jgi:four helix bundle protein